MTGCPLCDAWISVAPGRIDAVPASMAHAILTFGWWMGQHAGTHDRVCPKHREQFTQLEAIFGVPARAPEPPPPPEPHYAHRRSTRRCPTCGQCVG